MNTGVLASLTFTLISNTAANIIFDWVQPACHPDAVWSGCLAGQYCTIYGTCKSSHSLEKRQISSDGRCGPVNGGLVCDPSSATYNGTCCSSYGWCGSSNDHCGIGCVSGCPQSNTTSGQASSTSLPSSSIIVPSASLSQSAANGEATIVISATVTAGGAEATSGGVTSDGSCGAMNGGTVCGNWRAGSCCSMYGFCGNTFVDITRASCQPN